MPRPLLDSLYMAVRESVQVFKSGCQEKSRQSNWLGRKEDEFDFKYGVSDEGGTYR